MMPADVKAATPILIISIVVVAIISGLCIYAGIISLGAETKTVLEIFDVKLSTDNVGVALVAIGVLSMMYVIFRLFKVIKELAALPENRR